MTFWVLVSMVVAILVFLTVMAIIETKKNRLLEVEQRIRRCKGIHFVARRHNEICLALIREKKRKGKNMVLPPKDTSES